MMFLLHVCFEAILEFVRNVDCAFTSNFNFELRCAFDMFGSTDVLVERRLNVLFHNVFVQFCV